MFVWHNGLHACRLESVIRIAFVQRQVLKWGSRSTRKKCAENARKDGVILVTLRLSTHISTFYNNLKIMLAPSLIFLKFQHKIQAKAPNKGTLSQSAWDNLGHPPAWHATAADTDYERATSFPIPFKARAWIPHPDLSNLIIHWYHWCHVHNPGLGPCYSMLVHPAPPRVANVRKENHCNLGKCPKQPNDDGRLIEIVASQISSSQS